MQHYRKGLTKQSVEKYGSPSEVRVKNQKTMMIDKEQPSELLIITRSLEDVVLSWVHTWFRPGSKDKMGWKMRCTCKDMLNDGESPDTCPVCAEQTFCEYIQRRFQAYLWVVDFTEYDIEGKIWTDTPKLWALSNNASEAFAEEIEEYNRGGTDMRGLVVKVSRRGKNAPACGTHFKVVDSYGADIWKEMSKSPRVDDYMDKMKSQQDRRLEPIEAAKEYFSEPDIGKLIEPSELMIRQFLMYVQRQTGQLMSRQDTWGDEERGSRGQRDGGSSRSSSRRSERGSRRSRYDDDDRGRDEEEPRDRSRRSSNRDERSRRDERPRQSEREDRPRRRKPRSEENWLEDDKEGEAPFEDAVDEFGKVTEVPDRVRKTSGSAKREPKTTTEKVNDPGPNIEVEVEEKGDLVSEDAGEPDKKEINAEEFDNFVG
jgi:hypothetical protein